MPRVIPGLIVAFLLGLMPVAHAGDGLPVAGGTEATLRWESATAAYTALAQFNGKWRGMGEGKWGASSAEKFFAPVLDGKAMCRGGSSVYPVQDRNPQGEIHETHSLITLVGRSSELILTEYDNEGFISRYALDMNSSVAEDSWVFELASGDNLPAKFSARLTLHAPRNDQYVEIFELDFNGKGYVTYLINRLTRVPEVAIDRGCHVE